jgi:WD40 repeat protein
MQLGGVLAVAIVVVIVWRAWPRRVARFPESQIGKRPPSGSTASSRAKPSPGAPRGPGDFPVPPMMPLVTLASGHGAARCVVFSPDGQTLATGGDDGKARLWALDTMECRREVDDHLGAVTCAAFSRDGTRLALGGADRRITVWDPRDGRRLAELRGHTGELTGVRFSPDGKRVASSAYDSELRVWDVASARMVGRLKHLAWAQRMDWSPDGRLLCAGCDGGWPKEKPHLAILWNAETGQEIARLSGHEAHVTMIRFSRDGKRLATGSSDSKIFLWDVETRQIQATIPTFWGVSDAGFLPDGKTLAVATRCGFVLLWTLSPLREAFRYEGHSDFLSWQALGWGIYCMAVSPDGSVLASADRQGWVKFWATSGGEPDPATTAASLGKVAAATGPVVRPPRTTPAPSELIYSVDVQRVGAHFAVFSPDGKRLAAGGEDGTIALVDAEKGKVIRTLGRFQTDATHLQTFLAGAFSPDGRLLATGTFRSIVGFWDVDSKRQCEAVAETAPVKAVAFANDGKSVFSATTAGLVKRWDVQTLPLGATRSMKPVDAPKGKDAPTARELGSANVAGMLSMALSSDGKLAATANWDATVGIWSVPGFKQVAVLAGHPDSKAGPDPDHASSTAFSPDGRMLVSTSLSIDPRQNVKLWDADTWEERAALAGHRGPVYCATFSPDGKTIATAGIDMTVRLWSAADGKSLKVLRGHTAAVVFVRFSPDGRRLASASLDGTVKVWNPGAR